MRIFRLHKEASQPEFSAQFVYEDCFDRYIHFYTQ